MGSSLVVILFLGVVIILLGSYVVKQYERGVVFRLGKLAGVRNPGYNFIVPFLEKLTRIDQRTITMDVPTQDVISKDNISIKVNAVVYFRVMDPANAIIQVEDYLFATSQLAQTTLRSVCGEASLDDLLQQREHMNMRIQEILDKQTDAWGIKVSLVEIKHIDLPQEMQRAMAKQAEAERDRRAKIIQAEGEYQAASKLRDAASILATEKTTLQLRYLDTLKSIAQEHNSTIVFPLPMDLIKLFKE